MRRTLAGVVGLGAALIVATLSLRGAAGVDGHVPKTYLVKVSGKPDAAAIARLRAGVTIELDDGRRVKTSPASIQLVEDAANPWYEVVLIEGRNRQIRRMFDRVAFRVEKIRRTKIGPLTLDLEPGKYRALTVREVAQLKAL